MGDMFLIQSERVCMILQNLNWYGVIARILKCLGTEYNVYTTVNNQTAGSEYRAMVLKVEMGVECWVPI